MSDNILAAVNDYFDHLVKSRFIEMFGRIDDSDSAFDIKCWKDVLEIRNGRDYKNVPSESGLYPVYGSGGIMTYVDEYLCPDNTVIIGRKGTINNPILVKEKFWNVDTAFGLIPKSELIDAVYLYWFCQFYDFNRHNKATTLPSLTKTDLYNIEMKVPPISYQQEFSSFVEQVDKSKLIFQQLVSQYDELIKSRFIEIFGDPVTNSKFWPTRKFIEVCYSIGDGLHGTPHYDDEGSFPFINGNNLNGFIMLNESTKFVNKNEYDKYKINLGSNSILISINGTIGKLAYYQGEQIVLGKSACYCNLKEELNKVFVFHLMNSSYFQNFLKSESTASTIHNVSLKTMRNFPLIMPPLDIQNQFADFVKQIDIIKEKTFSNLVHSLKLIPDKETI